jgi:hypothetical protein
MSPLFQTNLPQAQSSMCRSIQACTNRQVLEEDKRLGRRRLAVSHRYLPHALRTRTCVQRHQAALHTLRHSLTEIARVRRAISRFLFISVTFETHLYVEEDDRAHTIRFQNAREGFMRRFEGAWHIYPGTVQHPPHLQTLADQCRAAQAAQAVGPTATSSATATPWGALSSWVTQWAPGDLVAAAQSELVVVVVVVGVMLACPCLATP